MSNRWGKARTSQDRIPMGLKEKAEKEGNLISEGKASIY